MTTKDRIAMTILFCFAAILYVCFLFFITAALAELYRVLDSIPNMLETASLLFVSVAATAVGWAIYHVCNNPHFLREETLEEKKNHD